MIAPAEVRRRLGAVIDAMKASGAWDAARPADAAFVDMGAFGSRTMAFEQWLRWVFVPNVEALVAAGGPWPDGSAVAAIGAREGDTDPAIAALVPALAAFDALFSGGGEGEAPGSDEAPAPAAPTAAPAPAPAPPAADDNQQGWALLSRPGHTAEDLEVAVACFRRSIERAPGRPQAIANLGDALVELGREDWAVAELERVAGGGGPLAGAAHNWLGWWLTERDPARALAHLRDAVRLRPAWGIAWQNLARVLDASGELAEACRAYGEAIACGDARDDAFARDRRLQLEMQLAGRGEAVPPVPDAARADSAAFAIVRAAAARLPAPHVFMIRPTTRDAPAAIIGTVVGGRAIGHVVVGASSRQVTVTRLARAGDTLAFERAELAPARAGDAAEPLVAWLAELDPEALTPLDAGTYLRDVVVAALPGRWGWEVASYRPAAIAVREAGGEVRVVAAARAGGGVELALFPVGPGEPGARLVAETPARLVELAPELTDATRRAMVARDAFAARPFGVRHAAVLLARELRGLREPTVEDRYPAWPRAWLGDRPDGLTMVRLDESAGGCGIEIGRRRWAARSVEELRALVPELAAALDADRHRLRAERLVLHQRFRVLRPFAGFEPGAELELVDERYDPHDGDHGYELRDAHGSRRVWVREASDDDARLLADLDLYLARVPPG